MLWGYKMFSKVRIELRVGVLLELRNGEDEANDLFFIFLIGICISLGEGFGLLL